MSNRFAEPIATISGVVFLATCALLGAVLFAGRPSRTAVPLAFLLLVVAGAVRFGAAVGIAGSLIGAAIFARFLFPPLNSLRIDAPAGRASIGWMLLAGISLSYLFARPDTSDKTQHK